MSPYELIEDGGSGGSNSCDALAQEHFPAGSGQWCRGSLSLNDRIRGAVRELLDDAGKHPDYGPHSSFGMLSQFLAHPQSNLAPGGQDTIGHRIADIIGRELRVASQPGGVPDWGRAANEIAAACFDVELAATGRAVHLGGLQGSTELCIAAAMTLRREATPGVVFNADHDRTLFDGISINVFFVSGDLGTLFRRLRDQFGFQDGLRAGSSLLKVNRFIENRLRVCNRYIRTLEDAGCPVP